MRYQQNRLSMLLDKNIFTVKLIFFRESYRLGSSILEQFGCLHMNHLCIKYIPRYISNQGKWQKYTILQDESWRGWRKSPEGLARHSVYTYR